MVSSTPRNPRKFIHHENFYAYGILPIWSHCVLLSVQHTQKWYVHTVSSYKETVHTYRFCIQRNRMYFVCRNGTYVLFLRMQKWYIHTETVCTISAYKEMVYTYVLFLHTKKQYVPFPYFCMLISLHTYVLCIIMIIMPCNNHYFICMDQ